MADCVACPGQTEDDFGELMGHTECNRTVNFAGPARLIGQRVDVNITETRTFTLRGEVVVKEQAEAL